MNAAWLPLSFIEFKAEGWQNRHDKVDCPPVNLLRMESFSQTDILFQIIIVFSNNVVSLNPLSLLQKERKIVC